MTTKRALVRRGRLKRVVALAAVTVMAGWVVAAVTVPTPTRTAEPSLVSPGRPAVHGELPPYDKLAASFLATSTTTTSTTTTTQPPRTTTTQRASRSVAAPVPPPPVAGAVYLGTFESTCYALTGTTASGRPAGPGSIAVDPRVIKMGTRLYVGGYGYGDARDTGGAIKGRKIDVWKSSRQACLNWGRRTVPVWEITG